MNYLFTFYHYMKKNIKIIGVATLFIIMILFQFFVVTNMKNKYEKSNAASAKEIYPERAETLGAWIDSGSETYIAASKRRNELLKKIEEEESKMSKASVVNAGLRSSLCHEFNLKREKGMFVRVASESDCEKLNFFQ